MMVEKARIKFNIHLSNGNYKGYHLFKMHPQKGYGFDPSWVIWFTKDYFQDGRPRYGFMAYTLDDLKGLIDNSKIVRVPIM